MRVVIWLAIFSWTGLSLAGCAWIGGKEPLETTIGALLEDPSRYNGKTVRVRGTFNECRSYECEICEQQAYSPLKKSQKGSENCGGIWFAVDPSVLPWAQNDGRYGSAALRLLDEVEALARFSTSTIDATFSAKCLEPFIDEETGEMIVCGHRGAIFYDARIISQHVRRPATMGVIDFYGDDRLVPPGTNDAQALREAFLEAQSIPPVSEERAHAEYVFINEEPPDPYLSPGVELEGGACICPSETCKSEDWPRRDGEIWDRLPLNPYQCWRAFKRRGKWVFPINF